MKVLFYYRVFESVGLEYIGALLKQHGHEVELVFDPGFDDNTYFKFAPLKVLNREKRLLQRAREFDPDIIMFSCPTNYYPHVKRMARLFREFTDVPIVIGGPHTSAIPEYVLGNPDVDIVCIGEGEEATLELVTKMEAGEDYTDVQNLYFKLPDGTIRKNAIRAATEDLDSLPFPDREMFHRYGVFKDSILMITSRGCAFNCAYCEINFYRSELYKENYKVRRRSVENVIAELKREVPRYGLKFIYFNDDDFTSDPDWLAELCARYKREIGLPFFCFSNPNAVTHDKMRRLADAGCVQIFMGTDSGNEKLRGEVLNRPMPNELILRSGRIIKECGIRLHTTAIFGIPTETPEMMAETVKLIERLDPDVVSTYTFYPYPRTDLSRLTDKLGLADDEIRRSIYEGESSLHMFSVLNHPYKKVAYGYTNVLPIYNKAPELLRPVLRRFMASERLYRFSPLVYNLALPFVFPAFGLNALKTLFRLFVKSVAPERQSAPAT